MKTKLMSVVYLLLIALSAVAQSPSFKLYNIVHYSNTPTNLSPYLLPIKIAGDNVLLNASDNTPNQTAIQNFALTCPPDVLVDLDLEAWAYFPNSELTKTINKFITTIGYFKATNPLSPVGCYGTPPKQAYEWSSIDPVNNPSGYATWRRLSDSLKRVAVKIDNFQPSFYTYDTDTTSWRKMVDTLLLPLKDMAQESRSMHLFGLNSMKAPILYNCNLWIPLFGDIS